MGVTYLQQLAEGKKFRPDFCGGPNFIRDFYPRLHSPSVFAFKEAAEKDSLTEKIWE